MEADSLKLLDLESKILHDLEIKFEGTDKTLIAHKQTLATVSTVFEDQFYGPLSANARADGHLSGEVEVILEKQFDYETYNMFIRHIYGDKEIIQSCCSYGTLFPLLTMAKLYLIEKMVEVVEKRINDLKISMDIILSALEAVLAYRNLEGFKSICDCVGNKIVTTFSAQSNIEQHKFYKRNRQDNPELVDALIELMAEQKLDGSQSEEFCLVDLKRFYKFYRDNKKEQPEVVDSLVDLMSEFVLNGPECSILQRCSNCRMPPGQCNHDKEVNRDVIPHPGMQFIGVHSGTLLIVENVTCTSVGGLQDVNVKFKDKPNTTFSSMSLKYFCQR